MRHIVQPVSSGFDITKPAVNRSAYNAEQSGQTRVFCKRAGCFKSGKIMNFKAFLARLTSPMIMFMALPMGIAVIIALLPTVLFPLEAFYTKQFGFIPLMGSLSSETIRTLTSIVAGGAITALSLIYSLVLIVFTLATGNIGPRLLRRFYSERINQVTGGLFGGAFLYAIELLYVAGDTFVPRSGLVVLGLLAFAMVFQLIYFVRHLSKSITIDHEIAEIAKEAIALVHEREELDDGEEKTEDPQCEIKAGRSGYLSWINTSEIITFAQKHEALIWLQKEIGDFAMEGEVLFCSSQELSDEDVETLHGLILINQSRDERRSLNFQIDLLVELALRALSPGVNDTFTALSVSESLAVVFSTSSFSDGYESFRDSDDELRLLARRSGIATLTRRAFDPLRQASTKNMLMAQGLAQALSLIFLASRDAQAEEARRQARLLVKGVEQQDHLPEDVETLRSILPGAILQDDDET